MSIRSSACIALLCTLVAHRSQAAPTMSVYPIGLNGGNREWFVDITPDPALFVMTGPTGVPPNTLGGSLAVEIGFSIDAPVSLVTAMIDNVLLWPAENFGESPFPFGEAPADGLTIQGNQLFIAQGSDFLTATTSQHFLKIQTAGSGPTTIHWLARMAGRVASLRVERTSIYSVVPRRCPSRQAVPWCWSPSRRLWRPADEIDLRERHSVSAMPTRNQAASAAVRRGCSRCDDPSCYYIFRRVANDKPPTAIRSSNSDDGSGTATNL